MSLIDPHLDRFDPVVGATNWLPQIYWTFVGSSIAVFAVIHALDIATCYTRIHGTTPLPSSATPSTHSFQKALSLITARLRQLSNASLPENRLFGFFGIPSPGLGVCLLVCLNVAILLALGFFRVNAADHCLQQSIALRWGFLSAAQVPLIVLLAGKNNIIGFFTGHSYERLNWLHRWAARTLFLTATLHLGFWLGSWHAQDITVAVFGSNPHARTGVAAWSLLAWITFTGAAPARRLSYEFFVVQHAIAFVTFTILLLVHIPRRHRAWIWIAVAIFLFDRVLRVSTLAGYNLSFCQDNCRKKRKKSKSKLTSRAELIPLPGPSTKVIVHGSPLQWQAGQHASLGFPTLARFQTHPFSIASVPEDGKLEFVIKAKSGVTRKLYNEALHQRRLPISEKTSPRSLLPMTVEGAYGRMRDLRQFDTVTFIAGDAGASLAVPLLRSIVNVWAGRGQHPRMFRLLPLHGCLTRRVQLVWSVRRREQAAAFATQLTQAVQDVAALRSTGRDVALDVALHVTRESLSSAQGSATRYPATPALGHPFVLTSGGDAHAPRGDEAAAVNRQLSPAIALVSGRPPLAKAMRQALEQAKGEMAVVVCGPRNMNDDARRCCNAVAAEGAAAGKHGIWFRAEGAGY